MERTVESIFSLETMGIKEISISDYDRNKIDTFCGSIIFKSVI